MGEKKYSVILADPPWHFDVYSKKGEVRSAEKHYPTMDIEDIKALPVDSIADKDCTLFLWVTFPCLLEGLEVIKAWGFAYKTVAFVWVKQNKKADSLFWGMGYWTRSNVEMCILATKGRPKRVDAGVHQVVVSHIEEHSKKPAEVHRRISQLMGNVPKIELFARRRTEGFDVWGNEVECDVELTGRKAVCDPGGCQFKHHKKERRDQIEDRTDRRRRAPVAEPVPDEAVCLP